MTKRLDELTYSSIVASTPLVSIDLIVRNSNDYVLLGQRKNRPAQGYWFVPGGRIFKDETFEQAFLRLTKEELGKSIKFSKSVFLGPYQHHYKDSFSSPKCSTHYVVLAYQLENDLSGVGFPIQQHFNYKWWSLDELLASDLVHKYTKDYFS